MHLLFLRRILSFCLVLVLTTALSLRGEDQRDWLESYYEHPTPELFVSQLREWSADGTLDNDGAKPALVAFISQVLRQNREKIAAWYTALQDLPPRQLQVLQTAMLFSRVSEADEILHDRFGAAYEKQRQEVGKILELPLDKEGTLDMLWGFFYATGSDEALRRIVLGFRFEYAPEKPKGVDVPEGYIPYYTALPTLAFDSLVSNGEKHPRIISTLREMLKDDETLSPAEKKGVQQVLDELANHGESSANPSPKTD